MQLDQTSNLASPSPGVEPRASASGQNLDVNSQSGTGAHHVVQELLLLILRFYKQWISPLLPSACRFHPTCSQYAMEAIQHYGVLRGVWLGVLRLLKCHPFHKGGFDPVR
jgi:putative membrane protein insertion efficiency factor